MTTATAEERQAQARHERKAYHRLYRGSPVKPIPPDVPNVPRAVREASDRLTQAAVRHRELDEQAVAAREMVTAAAANDRQATHEAVKAGKAPPEPTAPRVEQMAEEAQRALAAAADVHAEAGNELALAIVEARPTWGAKLAADEEQRRGDVERAFERLRDAIVSEQNATALRKAVGELHIGQRPGKEFRGVIFDYVPRFEPGADIDNPLDRLRTIVRGGTPGRVVMGGRLRGR